MAAPVNAYQAWVDQQILGSIIPGQERAAFDRMPYDAKIVLMNRATLQPTSGDIIDKAYDLFFHHVWRERQWENEFPH